jgi:hypothetical protein
VNSTTNAPHTANCYGRVADNRTIFYFQGAIIQDPAARAVSLSYAYCMILLYSASDNRSRSSPNGKTASDPCPVATNQTVGNCESSLAYQTTTAPTAE